MNLPKLISSHNKICLKSFGYSMYPFLLDGDIVYLKKVRLKEVKINDILAIRDKDKIFTHRVIYKSSTYLITKGDNNRITDGKIKAHQIIGKLQQIKRKGEIINPENIYLFQSTLYFQEIVKIKESFDKNGVNFVFLKGLPLHLYFERKHPGRIYADCDLLIGENDYQKVENIFIKSGYQKSSTSLWKNQKYLYDKFIEISFYRKKNNFPIIFDIHKKVHFMINQIGSLDNLYSSNKSEQITNQFLREKKYIFLNNASFPILSPSNLVIYLALHLFRHNYKGWHMYEFLNIVIKYFSHNDNMWTETGNKIKNYKLENFIYPVFILLRKYYDISIPQMFLKLIKPSGYKMLYINKSILPMNILEDESRIDSGINRIKHLFFLSSSPWYKKILIIFNMQAVYSFILVMIFLLKRSLSRSSKST